MQDYLGRHGASERDRLIAAALVALGPAFIIVCGYHGQLDAVAILPAVAALAVWDRPGAGNRALRAGLLIGAGAALKSVPIVMLLALLPSCRDRREAITLVAAAGATLLAVLMPWLLTEPAAVKTGLSYAGVPGAGGLTLAVQPEMAARWLTRFVQLNGINQFLFDHRSASNALITGALATFLLRNKTAPLRAAVIVWLALWAFGSGFFFQYLLWGLPFVIMAGYFRAAAAAQLAVVIPAYLFYTGPWQSEGVVPVYATLMLLLWAGTVIGLMVLGRREMAQPAARPA